MSASNVSFTTAAPKAGPLYLVSTNHEPSAESVGRQAIVSREVDPLFKLGNLLLCLGEVAIEALF
jgi:hypothetical protein